MFQGRVTVVRGPTMRKIPIAPAVGVDRPGSTCNRAEFDDSSFITQLLRMQFEMEVEMNTRNQGL
jgi:hypothetical protein